MGLEGSGRQWRAEGHASAVVVQLVRVAGGVASLLNPSCAYEDTDQLRKSNSGLAQPKGCSLPGYLKPHACIQGQLHP